MLLYVNSECKKHTFEAAANTMDENKQCKYVTTISFCPIHLFERIGFWLSEFMHWRCRTPQGKCNFSFYLIWLIVKLKCIKKR